MKPPVRMGAWALVFLAAACAAELGASSPFGSADSLVCTVDESTLPAETGKKIRLTALRTGRPQAVYENHVRASMLKVFESERVLVVQLVASVSGSVDTIVLDKISGRFAHTTAGAFLDLHAAAETGTCRPDEGEMDLR